MPEQSFFDLCGELLSHIRQHPSLPGKRVGRASYYHLCSCNLAEPASVLATGVLARAFAPVDPVDLVLKDRGGHSMSLLLYPDFIAQAHPALAASCEVDTDLKRVRFRRYRANRPILHRKELLLAADSTEFNRCTALTRAEEAAGLLSRPFSFGFEKQWHERLSASNYRVEAYALLPCGERARPVP